MPANIVKKSGDEEHWDKAKKAADKSGLSGDAYWADVTAIFKKMTHNEVASTTTQPQVVRPGAKKESKSTSINLRCTFKETKMAADADPKAVPGNRFDVVLLEEGLGNMQDCYYYTRHALDSAVALFEGAKEFANHPKKSEEVDRPERDVYDIGGHFENLIVTESIDGCAQLCGELVVPEGSSFERERDLLRHAVKYAEKYPGKSFIGLSINAAGDASEVELETYLREAVIPPKAREKLEKALRDGVQIIRPVTALTDAVSCDLVTEAGAGGKINQMIEQEKKMSKEMEKKEKERKEAAEKKEMEKKEREASEKKEGAMPGEKPDPDSDEHDDADQDKELISDMLKKHLGEADCSPEMHDKAKEAYEAYKEMGMEKEDALAASGQAMKLARHLAGKSDDGDDVQKEAGDDSKDPSKLKAESEHDADGDDDGDEDDGKDAKKKPPVSKKEAKDHEEKKESGKKIIALTAEVARLREALKRHEIKDHLEKTLRESRLPQAVTKKFRECIGSPKSVQDITEKLKLFTEAYAVGGEAEGMGFVISSEKNENHSDSGLSLADCAQE